LETASRVLKQINYQSLKYTNILCLLKAVKFTMSQRQDPRNLSTSRIMIGLKVLRMPCNQVK